LFVVAASPVVVLVSSLLSLVGCAWRGAVGSLCLRCLGFVMSGFDVVAVCALGSEFVVAQYGTEVEADAAAHCANMIDPTKDYRVYPSVDDTSELWWSTLL
jgi:hypothetical protein